MRGELEPELQEQIAEAVAFSPGLLEQRECSHGEGGMGSLSAPRSSFECVMGRSPEGPQPGGQADRGDTAGGGTPSVGRTGCELV